MKPLEIIKMFSEAGSSALRTMTRRASPALFAVTMGTGSISSLFLAFPYGRGSKPMLVFSLIFFFLNLFFFVFFLSLSAAKYILYPGKWKSLFQNPVTSLYVGCFPMGATTLINVAVQVFHDRYGFGGKSFTYFIWMIWWLDVVVSFACCWVGVHVMITRQTHSLESMTAMWLLPVVTLIVGSSSGGVISKSLREYSAQFAFDTIAVSTFMVTVGLSLALMILVIYLQRLITYGVPPGATVLSVFLPLGPTGQAGFAIILIGQNLNSILPRLSGRQSTLLNSDSTGWIINVICMCIAFVLWSLATMWILYAFLALYTGLRKSMVTFRMSFWGLVFPNGVYANLTIQLADAFDSRPFRVWGAIYSIGTLLLWIAIFLRSLEEITAFFRVPESEAIIPTIVDLKRHPQPHIPEEDMTQH